MASSKLRRWGKRAGVLLGALVALVVLAVVFLHTGPGQEMLRARVEARLRERLTTSASLGALRFSLFSGIALEDLRVKDTAGDEAIRIGKVSVDVALGALARGRIEVREARASDVRVSLRLKEDGTSNLTGLAKPTPEPATPSKKRELVRVEKLGLSKVNVSVERPDGSRTTIEDAGLSGEVEARPVTGAVKATLALDVAAVAVTRPGLDLRVEKLATKARVDLGEGGRGTAKLGPTEARVKLAREGAPAVDRTLALPEIGLDVSPETLGAHAEALELAALSLGALHVDVVRPGEGAKDGAFPSRVALTRATVRAKELEALLGKPVLGGDVTLDVTASGPREAFVVGVDVGTPGGRARLDAKVDVRDKEKLGWDVTLTTAGLALAKVLPAERAPDVELGAVRLHAKGEGTKKESLTAKAELVVEKTRVRTTTIERAELVAGFARGVVTIEKLDAKAAGQEVNASGTYTLEGKVVDAEIAARLSPRELAEALRAAGRAPPPVLAALATGKPVRAHVRGSLDEADARGLAVDVRDVDLRVARGSVSGKASVQLTRGADTKLAPRDLDVDLTLRDVSIAELGRLRGKQLPVEGTANGRVKLRGDARAPEADVDLTASVTPTAASGLPPGARAELRARARGKGARTHVEVDLDATPAEGAPKVTVRARADALGPVTGLAAAPLAWELDVDLPETPLASLPLPPDRKEGLGGSVRARISARGTRSDVKATADVALARVGKNDSGPVDATLKLAIDDDGTRLELASRVKDVPVLEGAVRAALPGRGLLAAAREGRLKDANPTLEGRITIPEHATRDWARLAPDVGRLPGTLGGALDVRGPARDPELGLALAYAGYPTLAGGTGKLDLALRGTRERAELRLDAGGLLGLRAEVSPREILAARAAGGDVHVKAALEGRDVALAELLPDDPRLRAVGTGATLEAGLTADATISLGPADASGQRPRELRGLGLRGPLVVRGGAVRLPGTARVIQGVLLRLEGDGDRIAVRTLEAHESDRDVKDRKLVASGAYALRTRDLALHASLDKVLVSGGNFGELDAPRAALSGELDVRAALGGEVRKIEVDVSSLELVSPDRQPRAVYQEVTSLGDVIELGASGARIGKLPVPAKPSEPATPDAPKTLDLVVRLPNAVHVMQRPLDLWARGEVHVERFGERRVMAGKLVCLDGSLLVGGREHRLAYGEIRMQDDGPMLDLHFRREPNPAALRDLATADGTWVYAHMNGILGKQKIAFSGAVDGLFEALSIENGGRVRVLARPDLPPGSTPQLPQVPQIRQTAFMSANLPHLAFLDRLSTHADPYASRFSYGRFQDLEAERYSQDGTRRLRVTARSRVIGQSDAEVEGDLLFLNTPRVVSGVGVLGGTRVGGGPTIFWEWSSPD